LFFFSFTKNALATNKNRKKPSSAENLKDSDSYYKYGSLAPATVPGSKSFWTKKWLDLVAIVSEKGPADMFYVSTANDSWAELKDILSQYENPACILQLLVLQKPLILYGSKLRIFISLNATSISSCDSNKPLI
jgi:hypothetical protein